MSQRLSCPNCGSPVAFGARFCGNCGTGLSWSTQQQLQHPSQSEQTHMDGVGLIGKALGHANLIGKTLVLINEGKCDEALQYIDKALEMNRNLPIAWSIKGEALHKLNRFQEAIECYSMAIALAPLDTSDARFGKGLAYYDLGDYERALTEFELFRSFYPDGIDCRYYEGMAHSNIGRYKRAMEIFDQAIELIREDERKTRKHVHDDRFIFDFSMYKSW